MSSRSIAGKTMIKTYTELIRIPTFAERFRYLKTSVTETAEIQASFNHARYLLQDFYSSIEWKQLRRAIVVRDNGLDLGCEGREIPYHPIVHHMNPIRPEDIINRTRFLLDPEYLICVSHRTHNAIHYGDESILYEEPILRRPGDTKSW